MKDILTFVLVVFPDDAPWLQRCLDCIWEQTDDRWSLRLGIVEKEDSDDTYHHVLSNFWRTHPISKLSAQSIWVDSQDPTIEMGSYFESLERTTSIGRFIRLSGSTFVHPNLVQSVGRNPEYKVLDYYVEFPKETGGPLSYGEQRPPRDPAPWDINLVRFWIH